MQGRATSMQDVWIITRLLRDTAQPSWSEGKGGFPGVRAAGG